MDPRRPQHEPDAQGTAKEIASPVSHLTELVAGVPGAGVRRPALTLPAATKGALTGASQGGTAGEDAVRDSWLSFASTAASRDSVAPSIFSVRASTASASTRYSVRQSSIESPISATSPLYHEHRKDSLTHHHRYCCTFCDQSFDSKTEWKLHELELHDRRERYPCINCPAFFAQVSLLAEHRERRHGLKSGPDMTEAVEYSTIRSAWGCGFCAASISSRNDYLEHVGSHYDEGKSRHEWQHTRVIEGLLRQPKVVTAWTALVTKEEQARGSKLRFQWDPNTTGRSLDVEGRPSLQDVLEFFVTGTTTPHEAAEMAYRSAQVRFEGNVRDLISKVFTRSSASATCGFTPTPAEPSPPSLRTYPREVDDVVSPISPLPDPLRPASTPLGSLQSASASIGSTFHTIAAYPAPPARAQLPGSGGVLLRNVPRPSVPVLGGSKPAEMVGSAELPDFQKQGSLRRIDSARNLSASDNFPALRDIDAHEMLTPRVPFSKRSLAVPPISVQGAAEARLLERSRGSSPPTIGLHSLSITSSVRPHTSSSTLSTHTPDGSRGSDDSDVISEESFSEPDSWLEFDGKSVASRMWKRSFQQTVDRGMVRLWARYNHDWDVLVRQCAGERGSYSSSQPREGSNRTVKGASSRQASGKGLRPPNRPRGDEDEEEDDDWGGRRTPSSQSKQSAGSGKSFACPFRKHDPRTYNVHDHEVCAIRSWPTISRLKEHLYRRHYKIHCQRCKETFGDARELAEHEMSARGCQVIDVVPPGDITTYQEKQLKSRKHSARRQTDEEKWVEIYRLLFPGEERIPSPYPEVAEDLGPISSESRASLDLQHFLLTEMPRLFTQTAEEHAGRRIEAREGLPMESIPRIIEEALQKAFRAWEVGRGDRVPAREASIASMNFLQDTPASLTTSASASTSSAYPYGQSSPFHNQQLLAGMDHGFTHSDFTSSAAFGSNIHQPSHIDDSGFDEGTFFTSAPSVSYDALAPQYARETWAGMGLGDGAFGNPNLGSHFRGFQHG